MVSIWSSRDKKSGVCILFGPLCACVPYVHYVGVGMVVYFWPPRVRVCCHEVRSFTASCITSTVSTNCDILSQWTTSSSVTKSSGKSIVLLFIFVWCTTAELVNSKARTDERHNWSELTNRRVQLRRSVSAFSFCLSPFLSHCLDFIPADVLMWFFTIQLD